MVNKNFVEKIELLEELLNQDLRIINFFQTDLTKYKILLVVMMKK